MEQIFTTIFFATFPIHLGDLIIKFESLLEILVSITMEESVEPPEAKRPRVDAKANEEDDEGLEGLGGAGQGLEGPAPSSWLPSSAGSESQGGPSSVDSGLSGITNKTLEFETI